MNECCFSSRGDVGSRQCFRKPAWIDDVGAVGVGRGGRLGDNEVDEESENVYR